MAAASKKKTSSPKKTPAKKAAPKKAPAKTAPKKAVVKKGTPKKLTKKQAENNAVQKLATKAATAKKVKPKEETVVKTKTITETIYVPRQAPQATMSPMVQAVIDKSDIQDVVYATARGMDRLDETLLRTSFHADATVDLGPGLFQGTVNRYVAWVLEVMESVTSAHHLIGQVITRLEGSEAFVETYVQLHMRVDKPTGREDVFQGKRFLDRFERRPTGTSGIWKIVHRKEVLDWVRTEMVSEIFFHQNPDALWTHRSKKDLSSQMKQFPDGDNSNKSLAMTAARYTSKSIKL